MNMEQRECSETSVHNIFTPGNRRKERIHLSKYGEILNQVLLHLHGGNEENQEDLG
jgi:ribosomal protein L33